MIVVDLGCAHLGTDSVALLIARFQPELLFGFDPWPEGHMEEGVSCRNNTVVVLRRMAAWTRAGEVGFVKDGWASYTSNEATPDVLPEAVMVPCFDLAVLLRLLPPPVVLKLNVEGAEYPLLTHLVGLGLDEGLERCIVQWHSTGRIQLACPVEDYP